MLLVEFEKHTKTWKAKPHPLDQSPFQRRDKSQAQDRTLRTHSQPLAVVDQTDDLQATLAVIESLEKDELISHLQDRVQDKETVQKEFVQQYRDSIASLQGKMQFIIEENEQLKREKEQIAREKEQVTREREINCVCS